MNEYLLIYRGGDPKWKENAKPEELQAVMQEWGTWISKLQASGNLSTGGDPLEGEGKVMDSKGVTTDLSLAETKELVGGYSIIKAESLDHAVELTQDCPALEGGDSTVEIRQICHMG